MIVHSPIPPTDTLGDLLARRPELAPMSLAAQVRAAVGGNA